MNAASKHIQRVYLVLLLIHTLAASFIWGINTLFLLDAGLNNAEAFAANAFFTAGLVLFEVATGGIADTRGRRTSYLLRTLTFLSACLLMRDVGFTPSHGKHPLDEVRSVLRGAIKHGLANPPVRWVMLA